MERRFGSWWVGVLLFVLLGTACAPALPTLMPVAVITPVQQEQSESSTESAGSAQDDGLVTRASIVITHPASRTPLPTPTRFPTRTPFPSCTPTRTPEPLPAVTATNQPTSLPVMPTAPPLPDEHAVMLAGSKLGLHVVRNNDPAIMEFVRRAQPAVVKAVGDVGWLAEAKAASPRTVTIGRLMATNQDLAGDPVQAARDFVAEQLGDYLQNPAVDYWEGWNEPDPDQDMRWYASFEAERVRLLAEHHMRAAIGGFSAGVPELDQFFYFLPAIETAIQYGGILTLHEYGAPTMDYLVGDPLPGWPAYPDRGALALRYRWLYQEVLIPRGTIIPLVISEAGVDGILMSGQRPGPDGLGWRDFVGYWESLGLGSGAAAYINQLGWYDWHLRQDPYVIGFAVFTAGGGSGWQSYEINDILPQLGDYVVQNR